MNTVQVQESWIAFSLVNAIDATMVSEFRELKEYFFSLFLGSLNIHMWTTLY